MQGVPGKVFIEASCTRQMLMKNDFFSLIFKQNWQLWSGVRRCVLRRQTPGVGSRACVFWFVLTFSFCALPSLILWVPPPAWCSWPYLSLSRAFFFRYGENTSDLFSSERREKNRRIITVDRPLLSVRAEMQLSFNTESRAHRRSVLQTQRWAVQ